ncbi:hypothetical protein ACIP97_16225 [Peribacillus frigoritolerans]|uniref:hypothetical protein n=1 Tax=Peribacillus frigoritolerans TaxID=450367 RepID=UPI0038156704
MDKIQKQLNNFYKILFYILIMAAIPITLNYTIFSWGATGVQGKLSDWFSFFGNYLGLIGAVSIASFQMRKQNKRDLEQDLESKRSFVVVTDFKARLKLENVKTHEDSRIIETPGYIDILKRVGKEYNTISTSYLKLAHFGNSQVIMDCKIHVESKNNADLNVNVGVIEQGIEVFIPIVPPGAKVDEDIEFDFISIEYKTLMNESLKYVIDYSTDKKEYYCFINKKGKEEILFEQEINSANWTYPNKLKEIEKQKQK